MDGLIKQELRLKGGQIIDNGSIIYRIATIMLTRPPAAYTINPPSLAIGDTPESLSPASTSVASPGANSTPTSLAVSASTSSYGSSLLDKPSQEGRSSSSLIELVTEMGTSKMV